MRFRGLVVGQDQVARVDVSDRELNVAVNGIDGTTVDAFTLAKRR